MAAERIDPSEQTREADLVVPHAPLNTPLTHDEHGSIDRVDGAVAAEPVEQADRWKRQLLPQLTTTSRTTGPRSADR
jgi:hypothetical protein